MKISEVLIGVVNEATPRLGKAGRERADALITFLRTQGINNYQIIQGGKHPKLVFSYMGQPVSIAFPSTPSDQRGTKNAISFLRQKLAQIALQVQSAKPINNPRLKY